MLGKQVFWWFCLTREKIVAQTSCYGFVLALIKCKNHMKNIQHLSTSLYHLKNKPDFFLELMTL